MLLYRADYRTPEVMRNKHPEGFKAWKPLTVPDARAYVVDWLKKGLADLSLHIKYTKDRSTTKWVSTAINEDCGGQSGGAPIYTLTFDINFYGLDKKGSLVQQASRTSNLKPCLLLDGPSIKDSNTIALHHGPLNDAEVSFFTAISLDRIVSCKVGGTSGAFVRTGTVAAASRGTVTSSASPIRRGYIK
jgi:insecticidal toxin complex protein TccC